MSTHQPVQCKICEKERSAPLSLERHWYSHSEQPYQCETCKQGFQFASKLWNHRIKHQTFICVYAKCGKSFMRKSELTAHLKTYSGTKYKCECGAYETSDKCLYRQHQHTHSAEKHYSCKICGERFKHTTQVIRHTNNKH